MNVIISGKQYSAKPYRFPATTVIPGYYLCGPNGKMDTAVTEGHGSRYVYFRWTDGKSYYLPNNELPVKGSVVKKC